MIFPDVYILPNRGLYIAETDSLLIADLHLGWQPPIDSQTTMFKEDILNSVVQQYKALVKSVNPNEVIFVGDVIQRNKRNDKAVINAFNKIKQITKDVCSEITLIQGNHDPLQLCGHSYTRWVLRNDILITHGHEPVADISSDKIIFAHLHPVISSDNKSPGYIFGKDKEISFIIIPAFNPHLHGLPANKINWQKIPFPIENPNIDVKPQHSV